MKTIILLDSTSDKAIVTFAAEDAVTAIQMPKDELIKHIKGE
jgi:hypothetical protein